MMKVGFGGSCHWCTEAIFQSLRGVTQVEQGWISSEEYPSYSEAVVVHFDEKIISLESLIEIHLHTHSCTSAHAIREKYRSAVYAYDDAQNKEANLSLLAFQSQFDRPIITQVLYFQDFRINQETYLDYYFKNPEKAFCKNQIDPKLRKLISRFRDKVNDHKLKLK